MIIDFHTHVFSPAMRDRREELFQQDACFDELYSNPAARMCTAEELLNSMDECDVSLSVMQNIGWTNHELCVESNNYLLEQAARHPRRLIAFCSCQPLAGERASREIEHCVKAGAKGVGELRPDIQGFDLTDGEVMLPLAEYLKEQKIVLSLHVSEQCGHAYPGKGSIYPEQVYELACRYPGLKIAAAHLGGGLPFYELMPEVAADLTEVYYDTAALPFLYKPEAVKAVSLMAGSAKILFGSDWPLLSQRRVLDYIREADLTEQAYTNITGGNAGRLLGIE